MVNPIQTSAGGNVLYPSYAADGATLQLTYMDKVLALLVEIRVANMLAQSPDPTSEDLNMLRADAINDILPPSPSL